MNKWFGYPSAVSVPLPEPWGEESEEGTSGQGVKVICLVALWTGQDAVTHYQSKLYNPNLGYLQ